MKTYVILSSCFFFFLIFELRAQDSYDFPEEYIKNISEEAPHIPQRPNRFDRYKTEKESMNHRIEMDKWAREYPEEFKKAVLLDSYLYVFTQSNTTAADKTDPWPYPEFMRYPVTTLKPEFYDSGNPERDKRHFENTTQHWHYLYDKDGYIQKYGPLPVIKTETDTLRK